MGKDLGLALVCIGGFISTTKTTTGTITTTTIITAMEIIVQAVMAEMGKGGLAARAELAEVLMEAVTDKGKIYE